MGFILQMKIKKFIKFSILTLFSLIYITYLLEGEIFKTWINYYNIFSSSENINNFNVLNHTTSLREFLVETDRSADEVILSMGDKGFLAGIKYDDNKILVAVTEKRTKAQIDEYVQSLTEVNNA